MGIGWVRKIGFINGVGRRLICVCFLWVQLSCMTFCFFSVPLGLRCGLGFEADEVFSSGGKLGFRVGVGLSGWVWEKGKKKLWRVFWCASIYFVLQERNNELHGGSPWDASSILQLVIATVRARAISWPDDISDFFLAGLLVLFVFCLSPSYGVLFLLCPKLWGFAFVFPILGFLISLFCFGLVLPTSFVA